MSKCKRCNFVYIIIRHNTDSIVDNSECGLLKKSVICRYGVQFFENGCGSVESKK